MSREEAQERVRTEQLARLGTLLAGFAHEIRNPLSTIGLNLQLVKEDLADSQDARDKRAYKRVSVVEAEVRRLQDILEGFLRFVRNPEPACQPTDLNALLQMLVDFTMPETRRRGVALRFFPAVDVGEPPLDEAQIKAAVMNLLRNAADACSSGDEIMVSTRREGGDVVVRITDTGAGMSREVKERAFTPYFSTKKGGTGLGLPTARRIIEEHGGTIELSSEVGKGTQFTLRLPAAGAAHRAPDAAPDVAPDVAPQAAANAAPRSAPDTAPDLGSGAARDDAPNEPPPRAREESH